VKGEKFVIAGVITGEERGGVLGELVLAASRGSWPMVVHAATKQFDNIDNSSTERNCRIRPIRDCGGSTNIDVSKSG
jgi:hypothetical protein